VLLSRHPKVFCAGANIKEFTLEKYTKDFMTDRFKHLCDTLHLLKKPLVVGVNGKALGGGF
jgi:enoyl-CoA hydratase/carnithine racemase